MTRHGAAETVGQVRIFDPSASCAGYWLRWTEPDGTPGDTTAGRDPTTAIAKATALDRRLSRAAGPAAMTPLWEIFTAYLEDGCSPYTDRPWRSSTRNQIEDHLARCLRGHEDVPALDLDRALCDPARSGRHTSHGPDQHHRAAPVPALGLPHQPELLHRRAGRVPLPRRRDAPPHPRRDPSPVASHSDPADWSSQRLPRDRGRPRRRPCGRARRSPQTRVGPWGRLAPELAANRGPRWGEQFQLTADGIHPDGCRIAAAPHLHLD